MKKTKKIIALVCTAILLVVGVAVAALAEDAPVYTGDVATLEAKVDSIISASTNPSLRKELFNDVAKYLKDNPVDPASDGYDAVMTKYGNEALKDAKLLLADVDVSKGSAKNGVNLNRVNAFVKKHPIDKATDYESFKTSYDKACADQAQLMKDLKDNIELSTPPDEYEWKTLIDTDFEKDEGNSVFSPAFATTKNTVGVEKGMDVDNSYFTIRFGEAAPLFAGYNVTGAERGMVIEFDFTTFDKLPAATFFFGANSTTNTSDKSKVAPRYLAVLPSGDIINGWTNKVYLANAVVPGEWIHISIVFNGETSLSDVYINYELVAEDQMCIDKPNVTFQMSHWRMGTAAIGELSLDNFSMYQGTNIRTRGKLENMTEDELFVYYSGILLSDKASLEVKKNTYGYLLPLIGNYWKPGVDGGPGTYLKDGENIHKAVDTFNNFDYDGLILQLQTQNLEKYTDLIKQLQAIELKPDTLEQRKQYVSKIEDFLSGVQSEILRGEQFDQNNSIYNNAKVRILDDEKIINFINYIRRFNNSSIYDQMIENYEVALEIYQNGLNKDLAKDPKYSDFQNALDIFAEAEKKIHDVLFRDNAIRIVTCVGIINEYKTEQEWLDNYKYIDRYVTGIRKILNSKQYDAYYPGVDEAITIFKPFNNYFYTNLQNSHIDFFKEQLKAYENTPSYIEKLGIISYLERYIDKNEIDYNNPELKNLIVKYEAYKGEIDIQSDTYNDTLEQNTVYFINLINKLKTTVDYAGENGMKSVYDKASVYYYAINTGSEEAKEAVRVFDEYTVIVERIEEFSSKFIENVGALGTVHDLKQKFKYLATAEYYKQHIDESIDGVTEALNKFKTEYDAYMNPVNTVNAEIASANTAVASVRTNFASSATIAIIMDKIFS